MHEAVDVSGGVLDEERPAALDVTAQILSALVGQQEQGRGDDQPVAAQLVLGVGEVDRDTRVPQRAVRLGERCVAVEAGGGQAVHFERPHAVRVVEYGHLRGDRRPRQLAEPGDRLPGPRDLAEDTAVGARVREHRRVPGLGAGPGLPPLEERGALRAARDVAETVARDLPGPLADHLLAVVDGTGALLHHALLSLTLLGGESRVALRCRAVRAGRGLPCSCTSDSSRPWAVSRRSTVVPGRSAKMPVRVEAVASYASWQGWCRKGTRRCAARSPPRAALPRGPRRSRAGRRSLPPVLARSGCRDPASRPTWSRLFHQVGSRTQSDGRFAALIVGMVVW